MDAISRRSFLKNAAALSLLAPMSALVTGCDAAAPSAAPAGSADTGTDAAPDAGAGSVLVAYYSAQGHTQAVAEAVADELDADLFVITPADPYTADDLNYNDEDSRVSTEHLDEGRHVELATVTPENFDAYDTVLVGYPIWWAEAAWVVDDFIADNDFTGKTVIPFCTSASSGLGQSGELLAEMAGTGNWVEGMRFRSSVSEDDVRAWAASLEL